MQERAAEQAERSFAECVAELEEIAFARITDYLRIDEDGQPHLDSSKITQDKAIGLKDFSVEEYEVRGKSTRIVRRLKLRLHDKVKALVSLTELMVAVEERQKAAVEAAQGQAVTRDDETDYLAYLGQRYALKSVEYARNGKKV